MNRTGRSETNPWVKSNVDEYDPGSIQRPPAMTSMSGRLPRTRTL